MQRIYAFDHAENYDFDSAAVEFFNSRARLKIAQSEDSYSQPFASSTGFTFDSAIAEFVGGLLRQKDQRPAGAIFYASFASSLDANWSGGVGTGTPAGGAAIVGGKLDLKGAGKSLSFAGASNVPPGSTGCVRVHYTPNYNGIPVTNQVIFSLGDEGSTHNRIEFLHLTNGSLFMYVNDENGTNILSNSLLSFDAVAGQTGELEVNWDTNAGKFYVLGSGFLFAEIDVSMVRSGASNILRFGGSVDGSSPESDHSIDGVVVYDSVQHIANYTPPISLPDKAFLESVAVLPEMAYAAGGGTFLVATELTTVENNTPKFTIQIGRSGSYLYWNGSAWIASNGTYAQATDSTTFGAHLASLPLDGQVYAQIKVHFSTSNIQQSIDSLTLKILESTLYPTTAQKITPQGRFQAAELISFMDSVVTPSGTYVRYILEVDSNKIYWNGSIFRTSDGTFTQSNTKQEIEDHLVIALARSSYVKLIVLLKTDNSSATPEITSATLEYAEDLDGMRGYLNAILQFIGAESLTDTEFNAITLQSHTDQIAVYNCLLNVLQSRQGVSSDLTVRLQNYFLAKSVAVVPVTQIPRSNIFLGASLE